jgi:hypothetical protein
MENNESTFDANVTPMQAGLKYGVYLGLAMSIFGLIAHYGGLQDYTSVDDISSSFLVSAISWIILAALFFLGIKYFKNGNEGHLTLGEGMTTAMFIGLVSGVISIIFTFIFFTYVAPEVLSTLSEAAMESANADLSDLSAEEREKAEEMMGGMMGMFMSPIFMAVSTFFSRMLSAVLFGLVCSLILKTD